MGADFSAPLKICIIPLIFAVFVKNFSSKTARKPSVYKVLSHFCVIITQASILLTFPLAVPDSALTPIVAQSSTAALPYARFFSHCERSRRHLLLSYIRTSPICKIIDFEWAPENLAAQSV